MNVVSSDHEGRVANLFVRTSRRQTARLVLRPVGQLDLAALTAHFAMPELVAHRPDPRPDAPDVIATQLAEDIEHWKRGGFGRWAIEAGGKIIGFGDLKSKSGFDGLNISFHLHPDCWRQGFASEFVHEALKVGFGELVAERVIGLVRPANPASRRVLEKCGLTFERSVQLFGAPTNLLVKWVEHGQTPG